MRHFLFCLLFFSFLTSVIAQTPTKGVFSLKEVSQLMSGPKSVIEASIKRKGYTIHSVSAGGIYIYEKKGTPFDIRFKLTDGIVTLIAWQELKKALAPIVSEIEAEGYLPMNSMGNAYQSPNTGMKFMVFPFEGNPALIKVFVGM